jgi:hypothetical protein
VVVLLTAIPLRRRHQSGISSSVHRHRVVGGAISGGNTPVSGGANSRVDRHTGIGN